MKLRKKHPFIEINRKKVISFGLGIGLMPIMGKSNKKTLVLGIQFAIWMIYISWVETY